MHILIIGNGFDRAHGLPTTYNNFLDMCIQARKPLTWDGARFFNNRSKRNVENETFKKFCEKLDGRIIAEFQKKSRKNIFVERFINRKNVIGKDWLNFEEEIETFIRAVIKERDNAPDERFLVTDIKEIELLAARNHLYSKTYNDLFLLIHKEHAELIRLLEIYMDGYVFEFPINDIKHIHRSYDAILSFNYTCTYTQHYKPDVECCYIHGKADLNSQETKMVLGFDDHYRIKEDLVSDLIPYEKFFQRLILRTDNRYFDWIDAMKSQENNIVEIYGHSLAPADGDILKSFFELPNTQVHIYYLDEIDRYNKLKNITLILGANKTIELIGGMDPKITFDLI